MATTTIRKDSCCRCRLASRQAVCRVQTTVSSQTKQVEQVVVSQSTAWLSDFLSSTRLVPESPSTPIAHLSSGLLSHSDRNCSKLSILKRKPTSRSTSLLLSLSFLSVIIHLACLPLGHTHTLLASSTNPKRSTLEESTTTTTTITRLTLPQDTLYTSTQVSQLDTTTNSISGQDERPGAYDDDDDAEGCPGLSADTTAKAKNLSDTQRLVNLQSCLQKKISRKLKASTRDSMELFDKLSLSGGCSASLMTLMSSLSQIKSYAFKFFDASAKIPSGVLYGLLSDFGDFDQCLSIRSNPAVTIDMESEEHAFSGKYCLLDFHMNYHIELAANETVPEGIQPDGIIWDELVRNYWTSKSPKGFQIGMCFPSKCTDDDLDQIYRSVGESYNFNGRILQCQNGFDLRAQHTPDVVQRSILYVFYTFIAMTLVGTFMQRYGGINEFLVDQASPYWLIYNLLTCFSICRSWTIFTSLSPMKLHNTCQMKSSPNWNSSRSELANNQVAVETGQFPENLDEKNSSSLSHLSGLRLFVILWITMGHSFLYPSASNYQHYRSIINMNLTRDSVWFATTNFTLGIDMLLYMAGLVFVYKFASVNLAAKRLSKINSLNVSNGTAKIWCLLLEKICRFWPTYFAVIALAIMVPLLGDGPMWPDMIIKRIGGSCRKNWWSNLLFINNFQKESEICLPSSWFVSVLMQLFLIGSLILVIEQKYSTKAAMVTLSSLLIASSVYSFTYAFRFRVNAPVIRMDESFVMEMDDNIWHLYTNIFNNLGPFLIGMLGGYLLLRVNSTSNSGVLKREKESNSSISGWVAELIYACVFGGIAALVLSSVFYQKYSPLESSIYWSLHRLGWALFTGYIIHKCAIGSWTLLKDFLSLSSFIPISRLIFVAYLVYPIFIHMHSGLVRDGLHVSIYNMFNVYITRLVLTFSTSLIIHLLFEIPLNSLEELIYRNFWVSPNPVDSLHKQVPDRFVAGADRKASSEQRKSSTTGVLLNTLPGNPTIQSTSKHRDTS